MAASDESKLIVTLEARVRGFERALAKLQGDTGRSATAIKNRFTEIERSASAFDRASTAAMARASGAFRQFAAVAAGALSARQFFSGAEAFTRIGNSLRVAGVTGAETAKVFGELFAIAQRNAVPIESLAELYGRLAQAQKGLKASGPELITLTETVAQALRVGGKSATEASGALLQLGQALSGGKIQAEEYNSLLDGLYPLLQTAAAGLKEAGGDVSKLTALVKDGKVSSEAFFRAIQAGAPTLEAKLANASDTAAAALTRAQNSFVLFAGAMNERLGILDAVSRGLTAIAERADVAADRMRALENRTNIAALQNDLGNVYNNIAAMREQLAKVELSNLPTAAPVVARLRKDIETATGEAERLLDRITQLQGRPVSNAPAAAAPAPTITPVSLANFAPPVGTRSGSAKATENALQREMQATRERIAVLQMEAAAVGKTAFEQERARQVLELETAAKRANIAVTAEVRTKIDELSASYAAAAVHLEEMRKKQAATIQAADEFRSVTGDVAKGFTNDLLNGISAAEAFANSLRMLAQRLAALGIDSLMTAAVGPVGTPLGSGGILASVLHTGGTAGGPAPARALPASVFAGAPRFHNGLKGNEIAAVLERGEEVLTARQSRRTVETIDGLARQSEGSTRRERPQMIVQVNGATGNAEVRGMVAAGVRDGLTAYDKALPGRLRDYRQRGGRI